MQHCLYTYSQIELIIKQHSMRDIIATNLKALRKRQGWSMRTVAAKIFVSAAAYQKYEEKRSEPGIGTLKRIAELYGVTVDEIIKLSEAKT